MAIGGMPPEPWTLAIVVPAPIDYVGLLPRSARFHKQIG